MKKFISLISSAVVAMGFVVISDLPIDPVSMSNDAYAEAAKKKKRHPGKRLYLRKSCLACHGKGGARSIQNYPNVSGQPEKYIVQQIKDILSGKRVGSKDENGAMRTAPMTGALITPEGKVRISDEEIKQIANWLSMQPPGKVKPLETPLSEDQVKAAKKLYKKKCRSCHGKGALKPLKNYPILAGQNKAYIIAQVNDVKNKIRKNRKIKSMYPMVKKLTDEQIDLLASYLSQIDRTK
jgi:cytochrome c553